MNRQINLGALVEDQHTRVTAYDEVIDLGDNVEISTKRAGKSKTKVVNDSQWHFSWTKYSMVVLWAYPHRQEELSTYGQYILGQFLAGVNIHLNIKFDQPAHKFIHGHQELYFANISKLGFLPTRSTFDLNTKWAAVLTRRPQAPPTSLHYETSKAICQ